MKFEVVKVGCFVSLSLYLITYSLKLYRSLYCAIQVMTMDTTYIYSVKREAAISTLEPPSPTAMARLVRVSYIKPITLYKAQLPCFQDTRNYLQLSSGVSWLNMACDLAWHFVEDCPLKEVLAYGDEGPRWSFSAGPAHYHYQRQA